MVSHRIRIDINDIVQISIDIVSFENFEYHTSLQDTSLTSRGHVLSRPQQEDQLVGWRQGERNPSFSQQRKEQKNLDFLTIYKLPKKQDAPIKKISYFACHPPFKSFKVKKFQIGQRYAINNVCSFTVCYFLIALKSQILYIKCLFAS